MGLRQKALSSKAFRFHARTEEEEPTNGWFSSKDHSSHPSPMHCADRVRFVKMGKVDVPTEMTMDSNGGRPACSALSVDLLALLCSRDRLVVWKLLSRLENDLQIIVKTHTVGGTCAGGVTLEGNR